MNDEEKKSKIPEEADKTTITEKQRYKGKMDKAETKHDRPRARLEPRTQDTKPFPTRSRTNTTNLKWMPT